MQGSIGYKNAISSSDLEDLIPEKHFLRKVNPAITSIMDVFLLHQNYIFELSTLPFNRGFILY